MYPPLVKVNIGQLKRQQAAKVRNELKMLKDQANQDYIRHRAKQQAELERLIKLQLEYESLIQSRLGGQSDQLMSMIGEIRRNVEMLKYSLAKKGAQEGQKVGFNREKGRSLSPEKDELRRGALDIISPQPRAQSTLGFMKNRHAFQQKYDVVNSENYRREDRFSTLPNTYQYMDTARPKNTIIDDSSLLNNMVKEDTLGEEDFLAYTVDVGDSKGIKGRQGPQKQVGFKAEGLYKEQAEFQNPYFQNKDTPSLNGQSVNGAVANFGGFRGGQNGKIEEEEEVVFNPDDPSHEYRIDQSNPDSPVIYRVDKPNIKFEYNKNKHKVVSQDLKDLCDNLEMVYNPQDPSTLYILDRSDPLKPMLVNPNNPHLRIPYNKIRHKVIQKHQQQKLIYNSQDPGKPYIIDDSDPQNPVIYNLDDPTQTIPYNKQVHKQVAKPSNEQILTIGQDIAENTKVFVFNPDDPQQPYILDNSDPQNPIIYNPQRPNIRLSYNKAIHKVYKSSKQRKNPEAQVYYFNDPANPKKALKLVTNQLLIHKFIAYNPSNPKEIYILDDSNKERPMLVDPMNRANRKPFIGGNLIVFDPDNMKQVYNPYEDPAKLKQVLAKGTDIRQKLQNSLYQRSLPSSLSPSHYSLSAQKSITPSTNSSKTVRSSPNLTLPRRKSPAYIYSARANGDLVKTYIIGKDGSGTRQDYKQSPDLFKFRQLDNTSLKSIPKRQWVSQRMLQYYRKRVKPDFPPQASPKKKLELDLLRSKMEPINRRKVIEKVNLNQLARNLQQICLQNFALFPLLIRNTFIQPRQGCVKLELGSSRSQNNAPCSNFRQKVEEGDEGISQQRVMRFYLEPSSCM